MRDGRLILCHASRLPPALLAEAKARRDDLQAEVGALANDNIAPAAPVVVTCPCGATATFADIINPDLWQCAECLPAA